MKLVQIDRIKNISKEDFIKNYYKPQKPVVIEGFTKHWSAYEKWNFDYIKQIAGEKEVPIYDDRPVDYKDGFNEAHAKMKMADYIDLLKSKPTKYRIFLWNIFKEVPKLKEDFQYPNFGFKILKKIPMLFFGGENSHTFMHYDIDLANILHFHFQGRKQIILFDQTQTKYLYKIPHSLITREDIDFSNPDYNKFPALKLASGFETELKHGDTLYMPEGYWHYMKYLTPGFSMSLRGLPKRPNNLAKAIYNLVIMRNFDNIMRRIKKQKWIDYKNNKAIKNTNKYI